LGRAAAVGPGLPLYHIEKSALKADFQEQPDYGVILKIPL
jgi:hypothetical protein